jgi:protein TonB
VRRFGCALGLSLAIHSIALVAASTVGSIAPATVRRIPEPLFLILGAGGPNTGAGGLPSDFRGSAAALPETPPAPSDPGSERVVEPPSRRGSVPPSLPAARRDRIAPTRAAEVVGSRAATTTPTTRAIGGPTVSESGLLASGGPAPSGASGSGSGGGTGARAIAYEQTLAAWLNSHKYYPASLRRRGIEGEGKLQIRIARSGHVLAVDVAAAFPHPSLEAISQDWVKRAQPFPPVPDTIPGESYVFIVPVGFRLQ